MKQFTLTLTLLVIHLSIFSHMAHAQCSASIVPGGPTTFCTGGSVVLSATPSLGLQRASFGGQARGLAFSFCIGTKGYLGTGYTRSFKKDIWEYDPSANTWTQKADFGGTARGYAVAFTIGSKGYAGTGNDGNNQKDFWEFDPAANTWTKKADFGGVARQFATGFCIGSKGYLGTGLDGSGNYLKDLWEYNPTTNTWTKKADYLGGGRYSATGFCLGTKGYLGTGVGAIGNNNKDFYEFDPVANTWTKKADFGGTARFGATAFSLGSKGFIGGGYDDQTFQRDFWEYNPSSNTWVRRANFEGSPRQFTTSFSTGSKAYIGTGIDKTGFTTDFWEYEPSTTYTWSNGQTTPEITVTTSGTYTVTIANSTLGCSATSAPVVVKVNVPTTSDTTASVCNSFTWHGVTYYHTGDKIFKTTNVGGCDSTITLHLTISVIATTFSKTNTGCFGSANGSITINATSGIPPFTYRIGTVGLINSPTNTFNNLKAGSYRAYAQDATGCIGVAAPIVISQSTKVSATVTQTAVTGCNGSANGKLTISNPVGISPFKYKLGSNGTLTSFTPPYTISGLKSGNYIVYIQDASSCSNSTGTTNVSQPPAVAVNYIKTDITCAVLTGTLNLSSPGNTNATFRIRPGSSTYTAQNVYSGLAAGTYYCYAKDTNGCAGRAGPIVFTTISGCKDMVAKNALSGNDESSKTLEVSLWPNPSSSQFRLVAHGGNGQAVSIRVIDVNGRSVYEVKGQPEQSFMFGNQLSKGLYMVEVRQGNEMKTVKALKMP